MPKTALGDVRFMDRELKEKKARAVAKATAEDLPQEAARLLSIADILDERDKAKGDLKRWSAEAVSMSSRLEDAERHLREAIIHRGSRADDSIDQSVARYEEKCQDLKAVAAQAARRPDVEQALKARQEAETTAENENRRHAEAQLQLRNAAARLDIHGDADEDLESGLRDWLDDYSKSVEERGQQLMEWQELGDILQGQSLKPPFPRSNRRCC